MIEQQFRPKTIEERRMQLESTAKDALLSWDSQTIDAVVQRDVATLQQDYPGEYKIYVATLRDQRKEGMFYEQALLLPSNEATIRLDQYKASGESRLRGKQHDVFADIREHIASGFRKGYIKLPTGTGKTVVFTELTKALDTKTLIVVPRKLLVRQTADRFKEFAPQAETGMYFGDEKQDGKQVTITTYESLDRLVASGAIDPQEYGLLVLDEAHRSLTKRRIKLFHHFTKAHKFGFSATPTFSQEKRLQRLLGQEIHTMSIEEAAASKLLAPFTAHTFSVEMPGQKEKEAEGEENKPEAVQSSDEEEALALIGGGRVGKKYRQLLELGVKNKVAVKLSIERFVGEKTIANCVSIHHATSLVEEYRQKGITAAVIHGGMSRRDQRKVFDGFQHKTIQVICNVDLLTEGFDDPTVTVCLNLRDTYSRITAEQRGGRVLRLDKDNPTKHAHVVDIVLKHVLETRKPILFQDLILGDPTGSGRIEYPTERNTPIHDIDTQPQEPFSINVETIHFTQEDMLSVPETPGMIDALIGGKWLTAPEIASLPGVQGHLGKIRVRRMLVEMVKDFPEKVKQITARGGVWQHYHPEIAKELVEKAVSMKVRPAEWFQLLQAAKAVGRDQKVFLIQANKLRQDHPEWFGHFLEKENGTNYTEYFSPQVVIAVQEIFSQYKPAPDTWIPKRDIPTMLGRSLGVCIKLIDFVASENVDLGRGKFLNHRNQVTEFISPELIEAVKKAFPQ